MFETLESKLFQIHCPTLLRNGNADRFSSQEVIGLIGITPGNSSGGTRRGGQAGARRASAAVFDGDLTEMAVICECGARAFAARRPESDAFLDREFGKGLSKLWAAIGVHLLSDGTHLYLETSAAEIVDILKNSRQPILGVCLSDAVRLVRAEVVSRKSNTSVTSPDRRRRAKKAS